MCRRSSPSASFRRSLEAATPFGWEHPENVGRRTARSVAEDRVRAVTEPLEHRRGAADASVGDERVGVDPAGVHAERAGDELAALLGELLVHAREGWAAV